MAEMIVRLYGKYSKSDPVNEKFIGRGDVVTVQGDGWPWSTAERESPDWIILKVDMPMVKAITLLSPEQGDELTNPLLFRRQFGLDLSVLVAAGHAIPDERGTRELRFPVTPAGEGKVDENAADPMLAIEAELKAGYRTTARGTRARGVITITEVQFDAAKFRKPSLEDKAVIGGLADAGVIG